MGAIEGAGHIVKPGRASIDVVDAGGRLAATVFALKNCDVVVLALSPKALKTSVIIDELMLAEHAYKPVIPLILESMTLPPEIAKPLRYASKIYFADDYLGGVNGLLRTLAKASQPG